MNSSSKEGQEVASEEETKQIHVPPVSVNPMVMGDLSVNSSFQTDINTLLQLGERAKYHEARRDELLNLQQALAEDQQRFRYRQEQAVQ